MIKNKENSKTYEILSFLSLSEEERERRLTLLTQNFHQIELQEAAHRSIRAQESAHYRIILKHRLDMLFSSSIPLSEEIKIELKKLL